VPTRRMVDDLRWLGFHDIVEVPHGHRLQLGDDFALRSYQFGIGVDSAAVIAGGGYTLFNCNDCKLFGLPLRQVLRDYPKIDFIFRSHSSASPLPLCIVNHEQLLPQDDGSYDSADQFARCAIYVGARYAIPFASNHCFLHPETRRFNSTVTTPDLAERRYAKIATATGVATQCVVMPPASRWSDVEGFAIAAFDFSQRDTFVAALARRHAEKLADQREFEAKAAADFAAFAAYFEKFLAAIPWPIRRWKLAAVVFRVNDSEGVHHWRVDPRRAQVSVVGPPPRDTVVLEVHAVVVNDCAKQKMFSVWTASKRIKIHLPSAAALPHANMWFTLFDLYETDSLPIWKNLRLRALAVRIRRWREPVEVGNLVFRRVFLRERFSVSRIYPVGPI